MNYAILAISVTAVIRGVNSVVISSEVKNLDTDAIAEDICQVAKVDNIEALEKVSGILRKFPKGIPDETTREIIEILNEAKS